MTERGRKSVTEFKVQNVNKYESQLLKHQQQEQKKEANPNKIYKKSVAKIYKYV